MDRRKFLKRVGRMAVLGSAGSFCGLSYSVQIEPRWLEVTHHSVPVKGLPEAFDGLRVVHLTDIHHGPNLSRSRVKNLVDIANRQKGDFVVLTGDYVSKSADYILPCIQELAQLQAPLGCYAVLGNHDHWQSAPLTTQCLQSHNIYVLTNRHVLLSYKEQEICLAGVGDLWEDTPDLAGALKDVPSDMPRILLSHNPDFVEELDGKRVDLMLAGHTHGGQVRIPGLGPPVVPSRFGMKYAAGMIPIGSTMLFVNRGIGVIAFPVRLFCRPEIAVLKLCRV